MDRCGTRIDLPRRATAGSRLVLGRHHESTAQRQARWEEYLRSKGGGFNGSRCMITSKEARLFPELAVRLRSYLLLEVYAGDDPAADFEFSRRAQRVACGAERIFFWGEELQVSRVRALAAGAGDPRKISLSGIELGTGSLLDQSTRYGPGYWEIGRVGSLVSRVAAARPIVHEISGYFYSELLPEGHTIVCMPRNRLSKDSIRGGLAVHKIATSILQSSWFWGLAPWYRMQGGFVECLDYREIYRCHEEIEALISSCGPLFFASGEEAEFAENLIGLNLPKPGNKPLVTVPDRHLGQENPPCWRLHSPGKGSKSEHNPVIIRQTEHSDGMLLSQALNEARNHEAASVVVFVPATQHFLDVQLLLKSQGYWLTALMPPKPEARPHWLGHWTSIHRSIPLAEPYYIERSGEDSSERGVLSYLRKKLSQTIVKTGLPGSLTEDSAEGGTWHTARD